VIAKEDVEILFVAIFSCQGDDPSELSFKKGEILCNGELLCVFLPSLTVHPVCSIQFYVYGLQ